MNYSFEWWHAHALTSITFWIQLVLWPTIFIFDGTTPSPLTDSAILILTGAILAGAVISAIAMWPAWLGFYYDAKTVKEEHGWEPHWLAYMIGSILVTVWLTAPIYLLQRHRHTGTP